ncbi:hypothetical protein HK104_010172 [Borealophlyctis nickersoniae]|nr:hypothetical protein HK104_010172 [Borealophlyctis nickersoniae]
MDSRRATRSPHNSPPQASSGQPSPSHSVIKEPTNPVSATRKHSLDLEDIKTIHVPILEARRLDLDAAKVLAAMVAEGAGYYEWDSNEEAAESLEAWSERVKAEFSAECLRILPDRWYELVLNSPSSVDPIIYRRINLVTLLDHLDDLSNTLVYEGDEDEVCERLQDVLDQIEKFWRPAVLGDDACEEEQYISGYVDLKTEIFCQSLRRQRVDAVTKAKKNHTPSSAMNLLKRTFQKIPRDLASAMTAERREYLATKLHERATELADHLDSISSPEQTAQVCESLTAYARDNALKFNSENVPPVHPYLPSLQEARSASVNGKPASVTKSKKAKTPQMPPPSPFKRATAVAAAQKQVAAGSKSGAQGSPKTPSPQKRQAKGVERTAGSGGANGGNAKNGRAMPNGNEHDEDHDEDDDDEDDEEVDQNGAHLLEAAERHSTRMSISSRVSISSRAEPSEDEERAGENPAEKGKENTADVTADDEEAVRRRRAEKGKGKVTDLAAAKQSVAEAEVLIRNARDPLERVVSEVGPLPTPAPPSPSPEPTPRTRSSEIPVVEIEAQPSRNPLLKRKRSEPSEEPIGPDTTEDPAEVQARDDRIAARLAAKRRKLADEEAERAEQRKRDLEVRRTAKLRARGTIDIRGGEGGPSRITGGRSASPEVSSVSRASSVVSTASTVSVLFKGPKKRRKWTSAEVAALEAGMTEYGSNWVKILNTHRKVLGGRTNVQLKDKARSERASREAKGLPLGVWALACTWRSSDNTGDGDQAADGVEDDILDDVED